VIEQIILGAILIEINQSQEKKLPAFLPLVLRWAYLADMLEKFSMGTIVRICLGKINELHQLKNEKSN